MAAPIFYDTYNLVKAAGAVAEKDLEEAQKPKGVGVERKPLSEESEAQIGL